VVHRAPDSPELRRRNAVRVAVATLCVAVVAAIATGVVVLYRTDPHTGAVTEAALDDRTATDRAARGAVRTEPSGTPAVSAPATATPTPTTAPTTPARTPTSRATTTKASVTVPSGCGTYSGNRRTACALLPSFGFATSQMSALDQLWEHESGWNELAENPSSGAYGIPQALPGSKMGTVASDWRTNPVTQIKWGLGYIKDRYGSPAEAWAFWQSNNWY
jgi:hypothetical protein